jgi:hypothetical protein
MPGPNRLSLNRALSAGDFRRMAAQKALDIVLTLQVREESRNAEKSAGGQFVSRRKASLIRFRPIDEMKYDFGKELDHLGKEAPCTTYIGRPVFENWRPGLSGKYEIDQLKSVHMTASACTAMFMNGIVDCKIGIERMTASQAVLFMKAVVGNVFRDRCRQYLSAAFNLHTPIDDDRDTTLKANGGKAKRVENPMEIARLGIDLVSEGGFDKVTWDGAENRFPSRPILEQLTHAEVLELVHSAHERGLTTYVSAGLLSSHMAQAVRTGLDGVGIGVSLHYREPETRRMGELKATEIEAVLKAARAEGKTTFGQAARLLARLDRLHFEKILDPEREPSRSKLFNALKVLDEADCRVILGDPALDGVQALLNDDGREHTCVGRARRLLTAIREVPSICEQFAPGDPGRQKHLARMAAGELGPDPADFVVYHRDFHEFIGLQLAMDTPPRCPPKSRLAPD